MSKILAILALLLPLTTIGQLDSIKSKLSYYGDFRFRIEQDWNSRKSDGSLRDDRSRLRYRLRSGVVYHHNERISFGFGLRTGNPIKQQDPQLTLGDVSKEFGTLLIGLERAYFEAKWNVLDLRLGKMDFPFQKNNELFWSDNVYPEGVYLGKKLALSSKLLNRIETKTFHAIINARGDGFDTDSYVQGVQLLFPFWKDRINLFPTYYYFRNIQNIPDGFDTFKIDYKLLHLGSTIQLTADAKLNMELDAYMNLEDYANNDSIPSSLKDEKNALFLALSYGRLKQKGDWRVKVIAAHLQRFAAVDFLAQNDWARWDYSNFGSPDGRLTNLNGVEVAGRYLLDENISLTLKFYQVEQLDTLTDNKENGSRVRFDLDIKF